jgi:phospholipid/cholesterol/gamma-HCH transport system substrate-binding protein
VSRRSEIQVGATVLAAIVILILGVTWLKEFSLANRVRVWHVRFPQAGGLGKSDEVQVNGIRKGSVSEMKLVGDQILVDLALATDVALTTDSRISIRNVGLMGEKIIAVDLRTTGQALSTRDTIQGIYELGLPEVMASMGTTITNITELAAELRDLTQVMDKDGNLRATLVNFRSTSEELRKSVAENRTALRSTLENFAAASKTAKSLTTDREAELRKSLDQFSQAAQNLNRLSVRLDSLRTTIQSVTGKVDRGEGTLGKLVNDDKLYAEVHASVTSLKFLIDDIQKNPKKYLKVSVF